jgi:hypothetical protein
MFVETKREGEVKVQEPWRQILIGAADALEQHGWIQGALQTNRGRCVLGAIGANWGLTTDADKCDAAAKFLAHINLLSQDDPWGLAAWNDEPGRTKGEVVTALREAAKGLA